MIPNLNGLKAFEAAGRSLNFRAAADELGVTQGAVAQQVRALEEQLGLSLFERRSKGLAFTAAGRSFHARIVEAFDLIRQASATILPEQFKVTISVTPTFAAKWLIPNLAEFGSTHPDIDLRVLATEAVSSFQTDGIDLAVRQGKLKPNSSLESQLLFKNDIIAVAAPSLIANTNLPLSAQEISVLPKLHDGHDHWPLFLSRLSSNEKSGRGIRLNQTVLAIEAAISGQGIALASRFLVEREIQAERLVQVSPTVLTDMGDFHLVAMKKSHRTSAINHVMDWLMSHAVKAL